MDTPETPAHYVAATTNEQIIVVTMQNGSVVRLHLRAVGNVSPTITAILESGESVLFTAVDDTKEPVGLMRPHTVGTRDGRQYELPEAPLDRTSRVLARNNKQPSRSRNA